MKRNQVKIGSILSYGQMALNVLIGLIYTPVMIRLLGKSEYGLYNTVASTISMLSLLSLGFNSAYVRYFAKYKKDDDQDSIDRLNGLFLIIFTVIGAVALVCGLFLSNNLTIVFSDGLTEAEYVIARTLMTLLTINLAISFPMSVFANIISANERFVFLKVLGMLKTVFGPLVTLPLLLMGFRSVAMVLVTLIIALITDAAYMFYVLAVLKNKFKFRNIDPSLFKSMFAYTVFIAINMIIDQINWNIDKMLLGRFRGTSAVAVYSVGYSLYHYYSMFSTAISSVFAPRIHQIVSKTGDDIRELRKQLSELFIRVGRIQFLILALISSGIVLFGKEFILNVWAGEGYENAYYVALLLIIPASIALIQNIGIEIQRAQNKHQFRSLAYAVMAVINLILSIFLCQLYGEIGSAFGTAISLALANGLTMNIYYHKKCNVDIISFWKQIVRMMAGLIIPVAFALVLRHFMDMNNIINMVIGIVLYTLVYCVSMWFIAMNRYEKNLITQPVMKVTRRLKK